MQHLKKGEQLTSQKQFSKLYNLLIKPKKPVPRLLVAYFSRKEGKKHTLDISKINIKKKKRKTDQ